MRIILIFSGGSWHEGNTRLHVWRDFLYPVMAIDLFVGEIDWRLIWIELELD